MKPGEQMRPVLGYVLLYVWIRGRAQGPARHVQLFLQGHL